MHAHFTCHRKVGGLNAIHKKLDRVMCDNNWRMNFPEAVIEVLQRAHSNHHSLWLVTCYIESVVMGVMMETIEEVSF